MLGRVPQQDLFDSPLCECVRDGEGAVTPAGVTGGCHFWALLLFDSGNSPTVLSLGPTLRKSNIKHQTSKIK